MAALLAPDATPLSRFFTGPVRLSLVASETRSGPAIINNVGGVAADSAQCCLGQGPLPFQSGVSQPAVGGRQPRRCRGSPSSTSAPSGAR